MHKHLLILIGLLLASLSVSAQGDGLGDSYYPQLGNSGYDVQHYHIDLEVDVADNVIAGATTIRAVATADLPTFNLDLLGLDIQSLTVDDQPADFTRDGHEVIITPSATLVTGTDFTVTVAYAGSPAPVNDPGVPFTTVGWKSYPDGIFTTSEPSGAMNWFPSNNHPLDKATFTFEITVDAPYIVAANGLLQDEIENADGTTTYIWEASDRMATYLAAVYISDFQIETETGPDGLPIRNYFPADASPAMMDVFDPTAAMIAYFSSILGPYPFEAYGVVVLDDNAFPAALENQTLSIFGRSSLNEGTVAHELLHQWLGNSVSLADWRDIWLNEGFATYFEGLWIEHSAGDAAFAAYIDALDSFMRSASLPPPGDPTVSGLFGASVYVRGALTLHALRQAVGDEPFFAILRAYYDRFQGGNVTTDDFIAVAEEISGQSLTGLFQTWLYAEAVPPPA
jgi:aminopeptidase N